MGELGISTLTACFINANRDPKKSEQVKPSDFWYFKQNVDEKDKLDPVACDAFFQLVADEKMPTWAVSLAPVDKMRGARGNSKVPMPRAWIKKGIVLLLPTIENVRVKTPLAIVDGISGENSVIDTDTGTVRRIIVPNDRGESFWLTNCEFDLVGGSVL